MPDHIGLKPSDLARGKDFYRAALRPLNYELWKDTASAADFGVAEGPGKAPTPAAISG